MAKQEYSFPDNSNKGTTPGEIPRVSDENAPDNLTRPDIPQLEPAIRGIAENAGFDANTLEGRALLDKTIGGAVNHGALRDGDANAQSLGTNPDYPVNLMQDFGGGKDLRYFGE